MRQRLRSALSVLTVGCALLWPAGLTAQPEVAALEERLRERVNDIRQQKGLQPLAENVQLNMLARRYSERMCQQEFFSHTDPQGRDLADRLREAQLPYRLVGENIAQNYNVANPVQAAVEGWMTSPGHRQNILKADFTQTGVGICQQGRTYYFTQIYYRPR